MNFRNQLFISVQSNSNELVGLVLVFILMRGTALQILSNN